MDQILRQDHIIDKFDLLIIILDDISIKDEVTIFVNFGDSAKKIKKKGIRLNMTTKLWG